MKRKASGDSWPLYLRLIAYLRPYKRYILMVLVFNFLYVIFNTLSIWMIAPVVKTIFEPKTQVEASQQPGGAAEESSAAGNALTDTPTGFNLNNWLKGTVNRWLYRDDPMEMLQLLCIFIIVSFTLKNLFAFGEFYWVSYVEQKVIKTLREEVYEHILRQPLQFFTQTKTGNLISRITNDINAVNVAINRSFTKLIRDPVLILLYIFILFNISWQLTLAALVIFPLSTALIQKIGRSLKRKSKRVQERISNITSILQEAISGIKVVKAFGMEAYENEKFRRETEHHFKAVLRQVRLNRLSSPLSETLGVMVMAVVMWYGGNLVLSGSQLSSEDFIRFITFLFIMMEPIKSLGELNNNIQIALASGKRIFEVLDTPPAIADKPDALKLEGFREHIRYEDVHFRYTSKGKAVLERVTLDIPKNRKVALVGSSGAGKTTMVNLLPRFYDVSGGRITIDGTDIRDLTLHSLRRLMGIVTQEVILFNDTVANNIAYGTRDYSRLEIEEAARLANAYRFIKEFPEQFDTVIGERGVLLSGGQRQRISIARAILKNPPILIFDEATSSLDSESEHLIQEAVENLMKDRTVLIIAHRLSSIINSDKIVLLEEGRILSEGRHEELLKKSERYRRLCELQFNG
ncbi:MAG: ABC transporter ATP-binding protein [Calditrichaeota bacterium]|nr:ABC transporter ATP-binding protein [Calditrichota bacterium]